MATLALFLVTIMWGMTFPLIKDAVHSVSPGMFVFVRLLLAGLLLSPLFYVYRKQLSRGLLFSTAILGFFEGLCYLCQTIGLETTSSANSAFITAYSVVMVPFLAPLFKLNKLIAMDVIAAIVCTCGIIVLSAGAFHIGDGWTLLCALFYALSISYLQKVSQRYPFPALLVVCQVVFCLPLPFTLAAYHGFAADWTVIALVALVFCSLFATAATFYLQARYQKELPVSRAALIYAFEPVFATLFASLFNHERVSSSLFLGGTIVFVSFLLSIFAPFFMRQGRRLKRVLEASFAKG
jgi:drug/metabolite transporter (DMT)-like permease